MSVNGRWCALLKLALVLVPLAWATTTTAAGWMFIQIVNLKEAVARIEGQLTTLLGP